MSATNYPNYTQAEIHALAKAIQTDLTNGQLVLSAIDEGLLASGTDLSGIIKARLPEIRASITGVASFLPEGAVGKIFEICDNLEGASKVNFLTLGASLIQLAAYVAPTAAAVKQQVAQLGIEDPTVNEVIDLLSGPYEQLIQLGAAMTALMASLDRVTQFPSDIPAEIQQQFVGTVHTQLIHLVQVNHAVLQMMMPISTVNGANSTQQFVMRLLAVIGVPQALVQSVIESVSAQMLQQTQGGMMSYMAALTQLLQALKDNHHLLAIYEKCGRESQFIQQISGTDQLLQQVREAAQRLGTQTQTETATADETDTPHSAVKTGIAGLYQDILNFGTLSSAAEGALPAPEQTDLAKEAWQKKVHKDVSVQTGLSVACCEAFSRLRNLFKIPLFNMALKTFSQANQENVEMAFVCYHLLKDDPSLKGATVEMQQAKVSQTLEQLTRIGPGYWGWEQASAARARLQQIETTLKADPQSDQGCLARVTMALKKLDALDKLVAKLCIGFTQRHRNVMAERAIAIRAMRPKAPSLTVVRETVAAQAAEIRTSADEDAKSTPKFEKSTPNPT